MSKITDRIERKAGVPGLTTLLAERLTPTDLQSLLLEVYRERARQLPPAAVLAAYASGRFVQPARIEPPRLLAWDQVAFAHLPPAFEALVLSPVCPLGTVSTVAPVDQAWTVATSRNTEVVSDSTNVLALECALRRQALLRADPRSTTPVHLAASHRLLRAQHYDRPDRVPHFSIFTLCSAGRDQGTLQFELAALRLHAGFYLQALQAFLGPGVALAFTLTDFTGTARSAMIEVQLLAPLRQAFEGTSCELDPARTQGQGYYHELCFHVYATGPSGSRVELADGGIVDWTQKLLSNAKERLVISGIGSERVCGAF